MNKIISLNEAEIKHLVKSVISETFARKKNILKEDDGNTFYAIGFTTKFYTLWIVSEDTESNEYGVFKKTRCQYLKNISTDLETARKKHPEARLMLDLRGHTSFEWVKCLKKFGEDKFSGGKYAGEKIEDCTDYDYLLWAWKNTNIIPYGARDMVVTVLEKAGYKKINDQVIVTPQEYAKIEDSFKECEDMMAKLEAGPITILAEYNLDEEGCLAAGGGVGRGRNIMFHFPNFKEMSYRGFYYGLPVDSKGKAKKIKGKEITIIPDSCEMEVSEYGWGATLKVEVKDFTVN